MTGRIGSANSYTHRIEILKGYSIEKFDHIEYLTLGIAIYFTFLAKRLSRDSREAKRRSFRILSL